jgi:hypothetical protein
MSRVKIGAVVAAVVIALTAIAYVVATQRLEAGIRRELVSRVDRAGSLLTQISSLQSFDIMARAQTLSRDPGIELALTDPSASEQGGREALARLHASVGQEARPDFVAVVDLKGAVVFADSPIPDSDDLKSRFKAVAAALERGQVSKDVWNYGKSTVRVGVAPVLDETTFTPRGAAIVAHALNAKEALQHAEMLGTDVVFFSGDRVVASSFPRQVIDDLSRHEPLKKVVAEALAGQKSEPVFVELAGEEHVAGAVAMPLNFEDRSSGALLIASPATARAQAGIGAVRAIIWALGAGALIIALLAMLVTSRLILHQADEIEIGVNEIINGDVDYSFRPVGADLDGLANNLNVMLARLLGRPEPAEEGLEEGAPARVMLDEIEGGGQAAGTRMSNDPDVVALAREPEADYYRRTFDEYIAARRSLGESVEGVTFESFSAKLRLNEANLKKKYNCKAVRFRVQSKGDQVSLKPVPIL